ncbi:MAG: HlyC/CorC family transporter [Acidimicrobiaceae bacterium]|jgi:CBS domain containing-hemolysin-like protein|nr:HlyC/CorC family transporter [Acidimicrobiaceae bacterium]
MILDRFRRSPAAAPAPPPSQQELRITNGLASLREATARDIMTPRVDVEALPAPVLFADVAHAVRRSGHSHFPVFEDDLDRLLGVLFVKDLFHLEGTGSRGTRLGDAPGDGGLPGGLDVTSRVREPYVVPESRSALEVLSDMRVRRRGFAVVVDEHGGFAGVLTIKDLVSELVGDLRDEFDRSDSPAVVRIDATRFLVDGSCAVGEVREATGADIPDGEYVTLGGFLFDAFGHIPAEGEELEAGPWSFRVARMDRRRVAKVVVQARSATIAPGDGESRKADGK